jgi:hypothetical protein
MQDSGRYDEAFIKDLILEFHKGLGNALSQQKNEILTEIRFDMNQLESRLNHRIDGVSSKVDRVEKELSSFRKDTNGQLHEIRLSLVRVDEKLCDHEERLLNLEHK